MTSENAPSAPEAPAFAAPRRARPLVPKPVLTDAERQAAAAALKSKSATPTRRSVLERKLASLHNAGEMLQVMDTELALQRAQRLHGGGGNRQAIRALSIVVLFALLIAGLGAMFWLQSRMTGGGTGHHRSAISHR